MNITHEELIRIGFKRFGDDKNDPFYKIILPKHNFGVYSLAGRPIDRDNHFVEPNTKDCIGFWLYGNDTVYRDINSLADVVNVFT